MEIGPKLANEAALRFLSGPLIEKTIPLQKSEIVIGREQKNDIAVLDPKVSRQHARIAYKNGSWTIENLSQSSYVAINQQRVPQGILHHNAIVHLGAST